MPSPPAPIRVLPPLWYRVVTGQVLRWRVQRALNRALWWRRHAARRALRWTDRHPEIPQALARDGALRLVVERLRRGRKSARAVPVDRPPVHVDSALDIDDLHHQPLIDSVDIVRTGGAGITHRLTADPLWVEIAAVPQSESRLDPSTEERPERIGHRESPTGLVNAVDLAVWNPGRFRRIPTDEAIPLTRLVGRTARSRVEDAHRAAAVSCAGASGPPAETAHLVAELAATGAPVSGPVSDEVADLLGAPLADLIRSVDAKTLSDPDVRERHSIGLRRLAHRDFSPRGTWRRIGAVSDCRVGATPRISVLLASNRADDVIEAARQVSAQRDVDIQLVVGLHGSHMSHDLDDRLAATFSGDLVVEHLPDAMNLGQVLNVLTDAADGHLVSKWDDDDWYDRWHLADLVAAMDYSGAAMVAKAAEFVYLEALDLTIRRFATGSERFSTTVGGGTLLLTRRDLATVRWAEAPRRVDRLLIDALEDAGRSIYRTHGFGYVLRRRGGALGQHTWQAGDSYFLSQSQDQRRGLDLAFAGFETGEP